MKNFILGCLLVILTSGTVIKTELLTVKPATPKSVVTYDGNSTKEFVLKYTNLGYVLKGCSSHNIYTFVVMEKY